MKRKVIITESMLRNIIRECANMYLLESEALAENPGQTPKKNFVKVNDFVVNESYDWKREKSSFSGYIDITCGEHNDVIWFTFIEVNDDYFYLKLDSESPYIDTPLLKAIIRSRASKKYSYLKRSNNDNGGNNQRNYPF